MTSLSGTLANNSASTPITLTQPSNTVKISNFSANPLFINFYGAATASNYALPQNFTFEYDGPAVTGFNLFSNSQTINYSIFAW